ncbi:MAG: protein kinase [Myxococcales bacterium]|nr:protein kinase [Myxococcales bacterium]
MVFDIDATPLPPPPVDLARPVVAGRYILDGALGEGGMGRVYRAYHRKLGRAFALKVMAPTFREEERLRAQFMDEARLASSMTHPNIVSVTDYGDDVELGAFMVMELLEGAPLDPRARLPLIRACEYLRQIADALEHIHQRGVVHGDLKPENMMVVTETHDGRRRAVVKLLDFGLARRIGRSDRDEPLSGTPPYLAPERITGGPATVAADVYALGAVAFELLTGAPPFTGELRQVFEAHLQQPPPTLADRRGEPVDERLEALVVRALAKRPTARHQRVSEFRYELQTAMAMLGLRQRRHTPGAGAQPLLDAFLQSAVPLAVISLDHKVTAANAAFCKMLAVPAEQIEHLDLTTSTLGEAFPDLAEVLDQALAAPYPVERRAIVGTGRARVQVVLWISRGTIPDRALHLFARLNRV